MSTSASMHIDDKATTIHERQYMNEADRFPKSRAKHKATNARGDRTSEAVTTAFVSSA
jgi:hypothetical protein